MYIDGAVNELVRKGSHENRFRGGEWKRRGCWGRCARLSAPPCSADGLAYMQPKCGAARRHPMSNRFTLHKRTATIIPATHSLTHINSAFETLIVMLAYSEDESRHQGVVVFLYFSGL